LHPCLPNHSFPPPSPISPRILLLPAAGLNSLVGMAFAFAFLVLPSLFFFPNSPIRLRAEVPSTIFFLCRFPFFFSPPPGLRSPSDPSWVFFPHFSSYLKATYAEINFFSFFSASFSRSEGRYRFGNRTVSSEPERWQITVGQPFFFGGFFFVTAGDFSSSSRAFPSLNIFPVLGYQFSSLAVLFVTRDIVFSLPFSSSIFLASRFCDRRKITLRAFHFHSLLGSG